MKMVLRSKNGRSYLRMESPNIERDQAIVKRREEGKSYQEIGKEFGITAQRVMQIIFKAKRAR